MTQLVAGLLLIGLTLLVSGPFAAVAGAETPLASAKLAEQKSPAFG